ncbi:MAG: Hpt domain-containing protein, partial [Pseudomonadota bacterium]
MSSVDEDREMIQGFVADGRELLDEIEPKLIELQESCNTGGATDAERLNSVFRLFHSLKGAAGFLNLHNVTKVTHEAENLLNLLRENRIILTPGRTDVLCRTCDYIHTLLAAIEEQGNDHGFEQQSERFVKELARAREEKESASRDESPVLSAEEQSVAAVPEPTSLDSESCTASITIT